nr:DUF2975 domain-containing protein [uncultured Flavobacterium sp.]
MKAKNNFVFIVLHIVAWIIFFGLSIEAGGLIVNFAFSVFKPEMVQNLYQKMDLSELYNRSQWVFYGMYSFVLFVSILKCILFYIVIMLLLKLDLEKPFNAFVSTQITRMSQLTLSIGLISYVASEIGKSLQQQGYNIQPLNQFWVDSQAFILMAAVVYVIALIFKKGVELQSENELTI